MARQEQRATYIISRAPLFNMAMMKEKMSM